MAFLQVICSKDTCWNNKKNVFNKFGFQENETHISHPDFLIEWNYEAQRECMENSEKKVVTLGREMEIRTLSFLEIKVSLLFFSYFLPKGG